MYLSRLGLGSEQIIGRSYGEFHPASDTDEFMEKLQQVFRTDQWLSYEHRSHRDNRLFLRTLSPVRGTAEDRTIAVTVISKDISAYKQAEEELRDSEERFRMIFELAPDAFYLNDLQGNFIDGNMAAEEITGYEREELIGKSFLTLNLLSPEEILKAAELLARNARGEATGPDEFSLHRQDGSRVVVEIMTHPVKIKAETAILGIARDITRRKQDEEKVRAALREREVMLREIHHRVKNNIQIISSLLRLQAQHVRDDKVTEILNESQSRIRSMALIHEKLYQSQDFARIDFSDYIVKMITHLFAMFNLPSDQVRFRVEAENIQLDINRAIPCGLIINELVTNALKHAFPGEKKGELIVRIRREEDDCYQLTVKDTGVGLPEGFDPDKRETLGFQIVHDLVKQLNGSIEFLRKEGTEIIIRF
jgi:PAS domain S-box-containing protein